MTSASSALSTITLRIPERLHTRLRVEAAERGFGSAEEYVVDLIDTEGDVGDEHTDAEVEARALKSLASGPAVPMDAAMWAEVRRRSAERLRSGGGR